MKLKNLLISVAAVASLAACSNDSNVDDGLVAMTVDAEILGTSTRAEKKMFVANDVIYVSHKKGSTIDSEYSNVAYQYDGENFSTSNVYYLGMDLENFVSCYPQDSISLDAANQENIVDCLVGSGSGSLSKSQVTFKFTHALAKLTFYLPDDATACSLVGLKTDGIFSMADGATLNSDSSSSAITCKISSDGNSKVATALIIPQSSTSCHVTVTCGDVDKSTTFSFVSGIIANSNYVFKLNAASTRTSISLSHIEQL